jgi:hypothetical protein
MTRDEARIPVQQAINDLCIRCSSADAVAAYLEREGFRGVPECGSACPLTWYLMFQLPDGIEIDVTDKDIWWRFGGGFRADDGRSGTIELPAQLAAFVKHFDEGKYPGCVEGEESGDGIQESEESLATILG